MALPRVSIVTPAYNAAAYLRETAESVRGQTFEDWEWIIVDDGSTDDTRAIAEALAAEDARIRPLPLGTNSGLPAVARNRGMAEARGDWIALLDADDRWLPQKLARQVEVLEQHSEAGAVCCLYTCIGDEAIAREANLLLNHGRGEVVSREEMLRGCPWQTSTLLMRRSCYEALGGFDEDPALFSVEDYLYFARLLDRFVVRRIPEALSRYRVTEGGSVSGETLRAGNARGWALYEAMQRQGLLNEQEARRKRSALYFEEGKDALFHLDAPFRRAFLRAIREGGADAKAWGTAALCWLPAPILRGVLKAGLRGVNAAR